MLCDNAFIYHSTTIEIMCAQLGTEISLLQKYCTPAKAQDGKTLRHNKKRLLQKRLNTRA